MCVGKSCVEKSTGVRRRPEKDAPLFFLAFFGASHLWERLAGSLVVGALPRAPPPFEKGGRKLYVCPFLAFSGLRPQNKTTV